MDRRAASDVGSEERKKLLEQLHGWLEKPMMLLALIWLGLFVYEVVFGLNPVLEAIGYVIWGLFLLEFGVGLVIAPNKTGYLKGNWLKLLALIAPALRILRVFAIARAARLARLATIGRASRGLRLLRAVSSVNRAMTAFGRSMGRRGLGYVLALTAVVILVGAAGIYAFENRGPQGPGIRSFAEALWWTAMIMTTLGSEYWPKTAEGRVLCFLLSLYSLAVFGYFTAALATFFVGRDADNKEAEVAGAQAVADLKSDIQALRREVQRLAPERPG